MICRLLPLPIVVVGFVLGGWNVVEFAVQASVFEPLDVGPPVTVGLLGCDVGPWPTTPCRVWMATGGRPRLG